MSLGDEVPGLDELVLVSERLAGQASPSPAAAVLAPEKKTFHS